LVPRRGVRGLDDTPAIEYKPKGIYYTLEKPVLTVCFLKMGECREVLGGGPAPLSKL